MKDQPGTPVRERVEAAIRLRRHAAPASPVSVSAICKDAAVSRANLYAHYPDLVAAIRSTWPERGDSPVPRSDAGPAPSPQPADRALLYLCLELRAEVEALRKRAAIAPPVPTRRTPR